MNKSLYIELLKKILTDYHRMELGEYKPLYSNHHATSLKFKLLLMLNKVLGIKGLSICVKQTSSQKDRLEGRDWPAYADTMIGIKRLNNIEDCFSNIIKDKIPGDFIETGVWRGGATIFMKALLKAHGVNDRVVWVADSFEGLPKPNEKQYPADMNDSHYAIEELVASLEQVKKNFMKYDLLDDDVRFLKGWFKDTLPIAPINSLALLRLDGDMYESTMDALESLYPKLSKGGFIIIDDWGAVEGCKKAVLDYRKKHTITEEIISIDWAGVYWRKETYR